MSVLLRSFIITYAAATVVGCSNTESYLQSYQRAIQPPLGNLAFDNYVQDTEAHVLSVLSDKQTTSHYQYDDNNGYTVPDWHSGATKKSLLVLTPIGAASI